MGASLPVASCLSCKRYCMRQASTLVSFVCNCLPLQAKAKPIHALQCSELQTVLENYMIWKISQRTINSSLYCLGSLQQHTCVYSPTFGDFVTEGSMKVVPVAWLQSTRVRLPSPPSIECNVLHESLSEEIQYIPCATPKRGGSWVLSICLWLSL
jgi:hypothetical protein